MNIVQATMGEMVYTFLERVIEEVKNSPYNAMIARHNGVNVVVHKESCIQDICDKFDMRRKIERLESKLKGEMR
jgi:hypothetical protein